MGLFDFLKSDEERKQEQMMQEMQRKIFPNGDPQMDREIREVRELLGFRYSYEDVKRTYVHAAAIYFVAQDKSQERIISSILLQGRSVVTKSDAIIIHGYLSELNKPKTVAQEFKQTITGFDDSTKLFLAAKSGIVELKGFRDLTDAGKFEVILFNSILVLTEYKEAKPGQYQETEEKYFKSVFNQAQTFNLPFDFDDLGEFINQRFRFYSEEISKLYGDGSSYMPAKLYNVFYENPLTPNPQVSMDLTQVMIFFSVLVKMTNWVTDGVKRI